MARVKRLAVWLCIALCGCAPKQIDVQTKLNEAIASEQALTPHRPSYNKKYYSYYIEPSTGRLDASASSNLFAYGSSRFLMNLNVEAVQSGQAVSLHSPQSALASAEGSYIDEAGSEHPFAAAVYEEGGRAVSILHTAYMDFCGIGYLSDAPGLIGQMLKIARTVRVSSEAVAEDFRARDQITYEGTTVQLFDYIAPESGSIEELFMDGQGVGDFSETDFITPSSFGGEEDVPPSEEQVQPEAETEKEPAEPQKEEDDH